MSFFAFKYLVTFGLLVCSLIAIFIILKVFQQLSRADNSPTPAEQSAGAGAFYYEIAEPVTEIAAQNLELVPSVAAQAPERRASARTDGCPDGQTERTKT